ncbi:MAG: HEPN domain-containing protein [Sporichthya sp.]|nr:HEPN domain-containing protein [Sporichthya sp.]
MSRWNTGRDRVERLLDAGRIERVSPDRAPAELMLTQATAHLESARMLAASDVVGAYQLAYDAARKALAALLANQGLRAKGLGGHAVLYDVARAQLDPPLGEVLRPFDWMRRLRNTTEYPDTDKPVAAAADLAEAIPAALAVVNAIRAVIEDMPAY